MNKKLQRPLPRTGRPTKYRDHYAQQAYKLCLLGATNEQLADALSVCSDTIIEWRGLHKDFSDAIMRGKILADAEMAHSLYHRGKGYSHADVHISTYEGEIILTDIVKHYPPDTQAASLWLRNRQPGKWQDKREVAVTFGEKIKELRRLAELNGDDPDEVVAGLMLSSPIEG